MGGRGPRVAGAMWARRVMRRRWLSIVTLGLLGAAGLAVSMAAVAGARQSDSAYARLSEQTLAADAVVFASQVGIGDPDWSAVAELPYVAAAGAFGLPDGLILDGPDDVEGITDPDVLGAFSTSFGEWRTDVDRPLLVAGRWPDPSNPNEVLANVAAADAGLEVGDELVVGLNTPAQSAAGEWGDPQGPKLTLTVTGVGKTTFESAVIVSGPTVFLTRAFDERYGDGITFVSNLMVRFGPGEHDIARLERDARELLGSDTLPVLDAEAVGKRVTNSTSLEANGLLLFAVAVAGATLALVGQALSRAIRSASEDAVTLRALGMDRSDAMFTLARPFLPAVAIAAVVGVIGAIGLSSRFPIGLAREVEPDVGVHADWVVLAAGASATLVAFALISAVSAWRQAGRASDEEGGRQSRLASTLSRVGAPVPVSIGARLALEPGRGRRVLPTRPALAGAVVGILGVVGGFTLGAGIDDAVAHPERFGLFWDMEATWLDPSTPNPPRFEAVHTDPDVVSSADAWRGLIQIEGVTQPTYALAARKGSFGFVVMSGRPPTRMGEIALGPATAREYGVDVGEVVDASAGGGRPAVTLTVVGLALFPQTAHSGYDQGAWSTPEQLGAIDQEAVDAEHATVFADYAPGVEIGEKMSALADGLPDGAVLVEAPMIPGDLESLDNVRSLPTLFAVFTTFLAIATLAHVSASVVRRRRGELAVLRSLGMTPRQTRASLSWQATTLAIIGIVAGIPAGLVAGRSVWRWVADTTPIVYVTPVALVASLLIAPVVLVVSNLLAWWPGRRAAAISPADALRTE